MTEQETMSEVVATCLQGQSLRGEASRIGVATSTLSLILSGKRGVGQKVYRRLLNAYPAWREALRRAYETQHKELDDVLATDAPFAAFN